MPIIKMTKEDHILMIMDLQTGLKRKEVAAKYNISDQTVYQILAKYPEAVKKLKEDSAMMMGMVATENLKGRLLNDEVGSPQLIQLIERTNKDMSPTKKLEIDNKLTVTPQFTGFSIGQIPRVIDLEEVSK